MLSGEPYDPSDPELAAARARCRELCQRLNALPGGQAAERASLLAAIFGAETDASIQGPFFCDYGTNIRLGRGVYFNYNCVVLDVASVTIGDRTLFGPAVQIYTATHPLDAAERARGIEGAKPIVIGSDVWVGGGAILCPGVSIGDRSVVGAGSVVTKDVPPDTVVAGNPARVIRRLAR